MRRRVFLCILPALLLGAGCARQKPVEVSGPPVPRPPAPPPSAE